MINILFVGPYRQVDSWGISSREYIRALSLLEECNLAIRPIYLSKNISAIQDIEDSISKYEKNSFAQYDIVIQHCLPPFFSKYGGVKNIGISFFETDLEYSVWKNSINLMDELWVPSSWERDSISNDISTTISVIPIPQKEDIDSHPFQCNELSRENHGFKFYFIGQDIKRKNIDDIVRAFHLEFTNSDNIKLVLKINGGGAQLKKRIELIKEELNIYPSQDDYRKEIIIDKFLTRDQILGIHNMCDCFVSASYGESFLIPAFDAAVFGKTPIINKNTGTSEFISNINGFLVESTKIKSYDSNRPISNIYTGYDNWYKIDMLDLQRKMRNAYELGPLEKRWKYIEAKNIAKNFTYQSIANKIKDRIWGYIL